MHIVDFICLIKSDEGEEIFVAAVDNGNLRVGYVGGFIVEGNNNIVAALAAEIEHAPDFDTASDIIDSYHITYWSN